MHFNDTERLVLTSIQPLGSSISLRALVNCRPRSITQWGSRSLTRKGVESQNMCLCTRGRQESVFFSATKCGPMIYPSSVSSPRNVCNGKHSDVVFREKETTKKRKQLSRSSSSSSRRGILQTSHQLSTKLQDNDSKTCGLPTVRAQLDGTVERHFLEGLS